MVGTEQGTILSCNRKAKTPAERVGTSYTGAPAGRARRIKMHQSQKFFTTGNIALCKLRWLQPLLHTQKLSTHAHPSLCAQPHLMLVSSTHSYQPHTVIITQLPMTHSYHKRSNTMHPVCPAWLFSHTHTVPPLQGTMAPCTAWPATPCCPRPLCRWVTGRCGCGTRSCGHRSAAASTGLGTCSAASGAPLGVGGWVAWQLGCMAVGWV